MEPFTRRAFLGIAIVLAAASTPRALGATEMKKLVIIGDSLTEGYGVAREQAYPALLQKKIDSAGKHWQVINSGISGSTSASALSRVNWSLKQKPHLILIALGANDGLRGTALKTVEDNLAAAVESAKKAGVRVVLAGVRLPPNYGVKYTHDFERVFGRVASKTKVPLIPSLIAGVEGRPELNLSDGIHPNEKGHAIVAETVFKALNKFL